MKKKNESSMRKEVKAKNEEGDRDEHQYYSFNSHQLAPSNKQIKKRFGIDLVEYIKANKKCVRVQEFLVHAGIGFETWRRWYMADPEIAEYNHMAKMILANRREAGGLTRDYDPAMITKSMAIYDPEWKEMEEWRSKLSEGQDHGGTKIVIMEKFQGKE